MGDPGAVAEWFPSIEACELEGYSRRCRLKRGGEVVEDIVTVNPVLRRLQYRIRTGMPVRSHLATVDVIDLGGDHSLVVYGTDADPDDVLEPIAVAIDRALDALVGRFTPRIGNRRT